ncbi:transposase [Streptomyces kronopolitis]|uniref:transposase n=1 Tax=Streptomyces kronopolitis TaxID=1612435 RepID=UPI003F4DACDF
MRRRAHGFDVVSFGDWVGVDTTSLAERSVPDELWELFRRVVPQTVVIALQGGGRRWPGDHERLAAIVFLATSGCSWRRLPPVFEPAWPTLWRFARWS